MDRVWHREVKNEEERVHTGTLLEAKVLIENWRREYTTLRPPSALGYKRPAPEAPAPFLNTLLTGTPKTIGRLTLRVVQ